jgi:enamine deaminase RidA (YjgF/YER057c/UK114 family)
MVVVDDVPLAFTLQAGPFDSKAELVGKDDPEKQAAAVLRNLDDFLHSAGSDLGQAVKLNVYLRKENSKSGVERVLSKQFPGSTGPAVSCVVGDLPDLQNSGVLVVMDAVAVSAQSNKTVSLGTISATGIATTAVIPSGPKIFISGMADTNSLVEATHKTLEKLMGAAAHLGIEKKDIVQLKAFVQPISAATVLRKHFIDFFDGNSPPVIFVEWISAPPNPPIEIELIAAAKGDFSNESESVSFLTPPGTTSTKVFSRVARVNHGKLIFFSGLYGSRGNDAAGQTREMFKTLGELLARSSSDFEHLAKATYYVSDEDASNALNEIRPQFYNPARPPAASKAKVKSVGLPGRSSMLDMIAVTSRSP